MSFALRLELRLVNPGVLEPKSNLEYKLKIGCGAHTGIEGLFEWNSTEKATESLDREALKEASPDPVS